MLPTKIELTMLTNVKNRNSQTISNHHPILSYKPFLEIFVCLNGIMVLYYALYCMIF